MGSYDNTDISYKAAGAETYHLPILYTEDERSSYAAWGIKKEKLLLPFAVATILIDAFVLCATVCSLLPPCGRLFSTRIIPYSGRFCKLPIQYTLDKMHGNV